MIAVRTCAACDGAWVGRCAQTAQRNVPLYFRCGECNKAVHSPLVCACVVTSKEEGVVFCSKACKISFDDEKVRVCDLVSAAPLAQAPEVIELEAIELHPPVTPRPPLHPPLHAAPRPPLHTALQPPTLTPPPPLHPPLHPAPQAQAPEVIDLEVIELQAAAGSPLRPPLLPPLLDGPSAPPVPAAAPAVPALVRTALVLGFILVLVLVVTLFD